MIYHQVERGGKRNLSSSFWLPGSFIFFSFKCPMVVGNITRCCWGGVITAMLNPQVKSSAALLKEITYPCPSVIDCTFFFFFFPSEGKVNLKTTFLTLLLLKLATLRRASHRKFPHFSFFSTLFFLVKNREEEERENQPEINSCLQLLTAMRKKGRYTRKRRRRNKFLLPPLPTPKRDKRVLQKNNNFPPRKNN